MNALVKAAQGGAVATANAEKWAAIAGQHGSAEFSGAQFLKFNGNDGVYIYGKDKEELPLGTQLAVNMNDYSVGYICWKEGEMIEKIMVPVIAGNPPPASELPDHGPYKTYDDGTKDGWSAQRTVTMRDVETGVTYEFQVSNKSGEIAMGNLLRDFAKEMARHDGEVPVVELGSNSFVLKNVRGQPTKYAPVLKIVGWADEAELGAKLDALEAEAAAAQEAEEAAPPPPPAQEVKRGSRRF